MLTPSSCEPLRVALARCSVRLTRGGFTLFPFLAMTAKQLKKAFSAAYRPADGYPRRKPYSVSPAFDVVVVLFGIVSAAAYLLS